MTLQQSYMMSTSFDTCCTFCLLQSHVQASTVMQRQGWMSLLYPGRSTHNMREMKSEHGTGDKKRTWNQKNYTVLFITFMSSNAVYIIYMWHTIVIQRYPCITVLMGLHYQLTTSYPCTVCTARTKRGLFIVQFHVCVWHLSLALTGCTKACKHSSNMW